MNNQPDEQPLTPSHGIGIENLALMLSTLNGEPLDLDQVVATLNHLVSKPEQVARPRGKRWRSGQGFG